MQVKACTIHLVFDKLTRLSLASKSQLGSGAIANLQSNDTMKLWMLPQFLHTVWSAPFQIVVLMGLLIRILGVWPTLAGLAVTVGLIPITTYVTKEMGKVRRKVVKLTDKRIKMVTEVVTGIKAIKLYAWEEPYQKQISELREVELAQVKAAAYLQSINMILFTAGPILISLAAFGVFAALGEPLTASVAFPALALFNLLRFPIIMLPMQIMNLINAKVSHKRLQDFLQLEETHSPEERPCAEPGSSALSVTDATFTWAKDAERPTLSGINFEVKAGELVVVIGEVGSGKSTLLQSILGESIKVSGDVEVHGSLAYTAQDPWIQNKILRDNIVCGRPFDAALYARTLDACGLTQDLRALAAGDDTEIGEKGINLSGGQKHRVALARAVYAQADVYLLDDPLSAVDAHVGSHLFDKCINGVLSGRTRVLVTHQLQFLAGADRILIVKGGCIAGYGTYDELVASGVDFKEFSDTMTNSIAAAKAERLEDASREVDAPVDAAVVADNSSATEGSHTSEADDSATEEEAGATAVDAMPSKGQSLQQNCSIGMNVQRAAPSLRRLGSLTSEEKRSKGQVKLRLYLGYMAAWGPLFLLPTVFLLTAGSERGLQQVQNWWLSVWASNGWSVAGDAANQDMVYVAVFFAIGVGSLLCGLLRAVVMVIGTVRASRRLHSQLLSKIMLLPMMFFDTQPAGRLINRFTKDTEAMDIQLGPCVSAFLVMLSSAVASIVVICTVSPWFLIAVVPLGAVYWSVQNVYIKSSRELKRLDSVAFSPIFNHFNETLQGLSTVRAFRQSGDFAAKNLGLLNSSNRCWWPLQVANRWLGIRLELIGVSVTYLTALMTAVWTPVNAGLAGLAVTSALSMTGIMNFMVRQSAELEINMNAVERILEYEDEGTEAPPVVDDRRPPSDWPSAGVITASDLYVRYREELDPVLKGISFSTGPAEKIGIAGRTGCGKSTLMMTLYRIVEPIRGSLTIDGQDILDMGLRDLRSRLALVPQDPVVFSGTIRSNLDPFSQYSDDKMWSALRQVSLATVIETFEGGLGLDSVISEGGNNLSVGQRQLLGLARALMLGSRILVLDEATSNIDNATDELIQATIRTAFSNCTVLTIAHRLHTIMHSDRIMVLDNGRIAEFDTPKQLLKNPEGMFSALVEEASKKSLSRSKSQAKVADLVATEAQRVLALPSMKERAP